MYKFKYREIYNTLTKACGYKYSGGLCVVQIQTFINFLTSEFSSLTRGERDFILKGLSYHTMLTKLNRSAHLVGLQIFHLRQSGPEKPKRMPQRSKPKLLNTMVGTQLLLSVYMAQVDYKLDRSPFDNQQDWSPVNYQLDWSTAETQLTCFSKYQISQPIASRYDVIHTPVPFPIWGLLWQLWLSYPLRTSVNFTQWLCTRTKSRIVLHPTKLNDKI